MAMPAIRRHWTVSAARELQDNGWPRYELIDGELLVTPSASPSHQGFAFALAMQLNPYTEKQSIGITLLPPADIELREESIVQPDVFVLPRQLDELETGWHMFPIMLRPESGIRRAEFQQYMEGRGIDTRMVWTGNVTRQPAFAKVPLRTPAGGLPNADRVMEQGLILPLNHGLDDDDIEYLCITAGQFLAEHGFANLSEVSA